MPVLYGYARASTSRQVLTLEAQQDQIRRYYDYLAGKEPGLTWGEVYVDAATSGRKPFNGREAGFVLNGRLAKGDHLVMSRLDRGFRNFRDAVNQTEHWHARGVIVHFLDLGCDTSTPTGLLILRIIAAAADYERVLIGERTRAVLKSMAEHGRKRLCANPPWGKRTLGARGKKYHVDDPEDLQTMAKIYEWIVVMGMTVEQVYWACQKARLCRHATRKRSPFPVPLGYRAILNALAAEKARRAKLKNDAAPQQPPALTPPSGNGTLPSDGPPV